MFRPIAMVVPDSTLIAEIILFGEGFGNCKVFCDVFLPIILFPLHNYSLDGGALEGLTIRLS